MFTCVRNRTSEILIIPHVSPDVNDLVLGPREVLWITDNEAWGQENPGAYALQEWVEDGKVEIVELDHRPRPFVMQEFKEPEVTGEDLEVVRQILFQNDNGLAMELIATPATRPDSPNQEPDHRYLTYRFLPVLRACIAAYDNYPDIAFPEKAKRQRAIRARIKKLES